MHRIKLLIFNLSKWTGLFFIARRLTRKGLRILCYHGFALADESHFRPKLFMQKDTFAQRMGYLAKQNYPVLELGEAVELCKKNRLPASAVVITIDDGFFGVIQHARDTLQQHRFPATVYVASYHALKQTPVFRLLIQYLLWKTDKQELIFDELGHGLQGRFRLADPKQRTQATEKLIHYGEACGDEEKRKILSMQLCTYLEINYQTLAQQRLFSLMLTTELQELAKYDVDVQLHTHRHRFPVDAESARRELSDNKSALEPLFNKKTLNHFCYPSGFWRPEHWQWLQEFDIKTATTCDPGFNYTDTPELALRRFIDGEDVSQIEFEAELSGFTELLRRARNFFKPALA